MKLMKHILAHSAYPSSSSQLDHFKSSLRHRARSRRNQQKIIVVQYPLQRSIFIIISLPQGNSKFIFKGIYR